MANIAGFLQLKSSIKTVNAVKTNKVWKLHPPHIIKNIFKNTKKQTKIIPVI